MRITTKVIQNNSLSNINTNKLLQDKLSAQMATEKKVVRPSDDPIVAIRALRLRTNVNQINQYYEKNVPDAEAWLSITESALSTMADVVTDMISKCNRGSNEDLKSEDRETLLTDLKALRDEVYATGNADYAGRTVFTGYRTDTNLVFTEKTSATYSITEQVDNSILDKITYMDTGKLGSLNESNFKDADHAGIEETGIEQKEIYRLRLSYDNVSDFTGISYNKTELDADGKPVTTTTNITADTASIYEDPSPYNSVGDDDVVLVKETGEVLLGKNVYNQLMSVQDDPSTVDNEAEIRVVYEKKEWNKNDLKPEHFFHCIKTEETPAIEYNKEYLDGTKEHQPIEYDVGLNQTIRVNTTADEAFDHSIKRDVDDMVKTLEDVMDMEKIVKKLEIMSKDTSYSEADQATIKEQLAAAEKSFTFLKEKMQKAFENGITKMQKHLDDVNYAVTTVGNRSRKLELIENRLMSQKTNFETLQSENEDADITEVAIQLSSAELTYNAALMSTGKILQTNLMQFI